MTKQIKNKVLKTVTTIEAVILFVGMSGFDSEDLTVPIIMVLQAVIWLLLFFAANPDYGKVKL